MLQDKAINPSLNIRLQKPESIMAHYSTKVDNSTKTDSSLKKLYLPSIQKKTIVTIPVSSITRRIRKSQSQTNIIMGNKKSSLNVQNTEKEKILLAKYSLSRIEAKINALYLNYKKLLVEKEDNLNIIKSAIFSDDPTYAENISLKIQQLLDIAMKSNFNSKTKSTVSTLSYENNKSMEDKINKTDDNKEKNNKNKVKEENTNLNITVNPISEEKGENEEKKEELNDNNKEENNNNEQNNNNNEEGQNKEENKNNDGLNNNINTNDINNASNQEIKNRHDYSLETRAEDVNKINSFNNSHLNNNNTSLNNININNSLEEQINSIKAIIEEKEEEKPAKEREKSLQIESGLFEKSSVPKRVYHVLKVKSELSFLKHKLINIQQKIRLKDEEIEELKSRAKMKNIIFQKNMLDSKMITLHRIIIKNKEIEEISLPNKNLINENLKKELKYYNEINKTFIEGNKGAEEDYLKKKNEFEEKTKNYSNLEAKNNNLKYKYNSLRLNDLKKKVDLEHIKAKVSQIDEIKQIIEYDKKMIEEKKKEIEEAKKYLEKNIDEYNKNKENKDTKYQEMNQLQREINSQLKKQKNEINRIRKETKDLDKVIYKEIDNFHNINKKDKDLANQMYIYKNKSNYEFLDFLKELENNENKQFEENKKKRFKKLNIGENLNHNIISKIKRRASKKSEEKKSSENLPLLEEKLEYFLNNKGEKDINDDKNAAKKK